MSDRREVLAERDQRDRRLLADWEERFATRGGDGEALPEGLGVTWRRDLAAGTHSWRSSLRNNADRGASLLVSQKRRAG